jgi:hypothetical protein
MNIADICSSLEDGQLRKVSLDPSSNPSPSGMLDNQALTTINRLKRTNSLTDSLTDLAANSGAVERVIRQNELPITNSEPEFCYLCGTPLPSPKPGPHSGIATFRTRHSAKIQLGKPIDGQGAQTMQPIQATRLRNQAVGTKVSTFPAYRINPYEIYLFWPRGRLSRDFFGKISIRSILDGQSKGFNHCG